MTPNIEDIYDCVLKLTMDCGKVIKDRLWKLKFIEQRSCSFDLVTETDKEIEEMLMTGILAVYPDHKFIAEVATAAGVPLELTTAPTWVIDPVDGTMNFIHGYPIVCISIALLIEKRPEIGIIYNPLVNYLFTAKRGEGAFLNETRIFVSKVQELGKALVQYECGPTPEAGKSVVVEENLKRLTPLVQAIRSTGSAAWNMAMVSLGAADAFVEFGLHIWDMAAGDIIVREAGGFVMDPSGGPFNLMSRRVLCTGTSRLAAQLIPYLKQFNPTHEA